MTSLFKSPTTNFWSTTLNGAIDSSVEEITLNSTTGLQAPGYLVIDREDGNGNATPDAREVIYFTGINANTLTGVTRGADGSTARSHSDGALVEAVLTTGMWNDRRDWAVVEHDTDGTHKSATVTTLKASGAEIDTGTEDAKIVTPKAIADSKVIRSNEAWDGWQELTALTRVSDTTATLSGDWTDRLQKGDKLWWLSNGSSRWNYIIGVSYSAPNTTITITTGFVSAANDMRFESGHTITEPKFSKAENPQGFPDWFSCSITLSGGSMTVSQGTQEIVRFCVKGRLCHFQVRIVDITTSGTAGKAIICSLPITNSSTPNVGGYGFVSDGGGNNVAALVIIGGDGLSFSRYDYANYGLGSGRAIYGGAIYPI